MLVNLLNHTINKPVCSTIISKSNISNVSNVSQHVKPSNNSKSMSSCNVRNRNVHIVNSVSHHVKPLSTGKSNCSRKVSKPVIRASVVVNLSKRACKQSFNISSHWHGVTKSLSVRNVFMTSRNEFLNYGSFIYHDVNIFNISHTNILYSSDHFYLFSFYYCKHSFFIYSVSNDIF